MAFLYGACFGLSDLNFTNASFFAAIHDAYQSINYVQTLVNYNFNILWKWNLIFALQIQKLYKQFSIGWNLTINNINLLLASGLRNSWKYEKGRR